MSPLLRSILNMTKENQTDDTASIGQPQFNSTQNIVNEIHHANFMWPENPADEMPVR